VLLQSTTWLGQPHSVGLLEELIEDCQVILLGITHIWHTWTFNCQLHQLTSVLRKQATAFTVVDAHV